MENTTITRIYLILVFLITTYILLVLFSSSSLPLTSS